MKLFVMICLQELFEHQSVVVQIVANAKLRVVQKNHLRESVRGLLLLPLLRVVFSPM